MDSQERLLTKTPKGFTTKSAGRAGISPRFTDLGVVEGQLVRVEPPLTKVGDAILYGGAVGSRFRFRRLVR